MPRKIEKNPKSKEEALRLAAEEFGVSIEELSYTVEREIGKGILGRLLGRERLLFRLGLRRKRRRKNSSATREQRRQVRERKAAESAKKTDAPKQNNKNTEIEKPPIKKNSRRLRRNSRLRNRLPFRLLTVRLKNSRETSKQQGTGS